MVTVEIWGTPKSNPNAYILINSKEFDPFATRAIKRFIKKWKKRTDALARPYDITSYTSSGKEVPKENDDVDQFIMSRFTTIV
jgi:hypothetical protein